MRPTYPAISLAVLGACFNIVLADQSRNQAPTKPSTCLDLRLNNTSSHDFDKKTCVALYKAHLGVGKHEKYTKPLRLTLAACLHSCGRHKWYEPRQTLTRLNWLVPVLLFAGNLHLAPLQWRYKLFTMVHLLGDPIDTVRSFLQTLEVKHEFDIWAGTILEHNPLDTVAEDLATVASGLDVMQSWRRRNIKTALEKLVLDPRFSHAVSTAAADMRTTTVTAVAPNLLAIFVFIVQIIDEFTKGDESYDDQKPPGNRIAFAVLYSWMLLTALLSTVAHRFCQADSCPRAVERMAASLGIDVGGLGLDKVSFELQCEEGSPRSAAWSGGIYNYRLDKKLFWEYSEGISWKPAFPTFCALLSISTAALLGFWISYITPSGGVTMRCTLQLAIFTVWLSSFTFTSLMNTRLQHRLLSAQVQHDWMMRRFWIIGAKDVCVTAMTLAAVIAVYAGVFNDCFGWSNGLSGLASGEICVEINDVPILLENAKGPYPKLVASGLGLQVLIFAISWPRARSWAYNAGKRMWVRTGLGYRQVAKK